MLKIRDRAADDGHRALQVLSVLFRKIGDHAAALEQATRALVLDGDDLDAALRCRIRLMTADSLALTGARDDARELYREALEHARRTGSPLPCLLVLNNWAYTELLAGEPDRAADLIERLQAVADEYRVGLAPFVVSTVAEVLHARGRSARAVGMLQETVRGRTGGNVFDVAGCWLTLARVQGDVGDLDAASASLDAGDAMARAHQIESLRVEALGSRAELLAARGDHAGAYQTHLAFHAQTLALRSSAAEARAQTQHAILLADAARREAARYREMSHRDPLTALHNRRHVDADLDARLARGETLTVAMVDLDHFKTVNDTFSHETGDAVLTRIARLLERAVAHAPHAYAARLGGEEFLLVLPDHDLTTAHHVAETLRHAIATTDWSDIAPGLPITTSTGLATTSSTEHPLARADLLRTADHHLYTAKTGGRDRVEPTPAEPDAHARRLKQPRPDADARPWPSTSTRPPVR